MRVEQQYEEFIELCNNFDYKNAEILLKDIIVSVLSDENVKLDIEKTKDSSDNFDYIGKIINGNKIENIVVDLKVSKQKLTTNQIKSLLMRAKGHDIKNIVLVSNSELTTSANKLSNTFRTETGTNFQVFGRKELDEWFYSYKNENQFVAQKTVHEILKNTSRQLAKLVAESPEQFMDIEWRDLERIIATVFSDFGYNVELTPASKDGGKDVIVWYKGESYIIEIKHWKNDKVKQSYISDFLQVVIRENRKTGLYLSSSGYTSNAFETLSEIEKPKFRYGDKTSMLYLLKMYERINSGIYVPVDNLDNVIAKISSSLEV